MDANEVNKKQELLDALKERLHKREVQAAKLGVSADPIVHTEIEDIKSEIERLEQDLVAVDNNEIVSVTKPRKSTVRWVLHIFKVPVLSLVVPRLSNRFPTLH